MRINGSDGTHANEVFRFEFTGNPKFHKSGKFQVSAGFLLNSYILYSFLARPRGVGVLFEWEGLNVCARIEARGPNLALKLEENRAPTLYKDFIGIALAGSS